MRSILSHYWFLVASIWYLANGVLHDIFVIKEHKGPYDRNLLRLLMDGHVLILSGIILAICWYLVKPNPMYASLIGLTLGLGMIVYCIMIFPFLKSFVTLGISIMLVSVCIRMMLEAS